MNARITKEDLDNVEDAFGIPRRGPWNKLAVTYVGLRFPLSAGWRLRLLRDGVSPDAPVAKGIDPDDWRWLSGKADTDDGLKEVSRKVDPHQYVLLRVDALEMVLNDLRRQAEDIKKEIFELRNLISKDEW